MKHKMWLIAALVVGGYLLWTSLIAVKETELVVISQFGRPLRVVEQAGLAIKLPDPVQTVTRLDKRTQLLTLEPAEFVTLERRNLVVNAFLLWRITNPEKFLASVRNGENAQLRLESLAHSEIGAAVGAHLMSDIFTVADTNQQMAKIFDRVTGGANSVAQREFGIEVVAIRPNRFGFPKQNLLAIYKRMESERDRIARQFRAEGEEEAARLQAETEREVRQLRAEAERSAQALKGESEAEAARIHAQAFEANPDYYQLVRSLESYQAMFGKNTTLVLSADSPIFETLFNPPIPKKVYKKAQNKQSARVQP